MCAVRTPPQQAHNELDGEGVLDVFYAMPGLRVRVFFGPNFAIFAHLCGSAEKCPPPRLEFSLCHEPSGLN